MISKLGPGAGIDLRRRGIRRETALQLVDRAAHLPARDRLLIEWVFRDGKPIAEIARIWSPEGAGGAEAAKLRRQLARRLHRLIHRMCSPEYCFVALHHPAWAPTTRRVAEACVLHGLRQREACELLGLSLHTVRRHLHAVLAMCASAPKAVAS